MKKRRYLYVLIAAALMLVQLFTAVPTTLAADERDVLALTPPLVTITNASFRVYPSGGGAEITDYDNIPQTRKSALSTRLE